MKWRCFYCLLVIITINLKSTGQKNIFISGKISNDSNLVVTNSLIKIQNSNGLVLFYANTQSKDNFFVEIIQPKDSVIIITVLHSDYKTFTSSFFINKIDTFFIPIQLKYFGTTLEEVKVKASPIWTRGDTTFFKVDAFTNGNEKKLKDILERLPGFEFTDNGDLLYKKKIIEKVLVEGENLFAENTRLLMNSFPSHVLEEVQVLENQNNNKLLKGFTGDGKVFLNLTLKNNVKLKFAFGDGEIGLGNQDRFLVNAVLVSIYGKNKFAIIASNNSLASDLDWQPQKDFEQKYSQRELQNWQVFLSRPTIINNFTSNRLLVNKMMDNRVKWNTTIAKRIKVETEIGNFTDRQIQHTVNRFTFASTDSIIIRTDDVHLLLKPKIFGLNQKLVFEKDTNAIFQLAYSYQSNYTSSKTTSSFISGFKNNFAEQSIQNKWSLWNVMMEYTTKISGKKALNVQVKYLNYYMPQHSEGISEQWQTLFNLPSSRFNLLQNQFSFKASILNSVIDFYYRNKKNVLQNIRTKIDFNQFDLNLVTNAKDSNTNIININLLSNAGLYSQLRYTSELSKYLKFFKKPLIFQIKAGFDFNNIKELNNNNSNTIPFYNILLEQDYKMKKKIYSKVRINYVNESLDISFFRNFLFPINQTNYKISALNSFKKVNQLFFNHTSSFSFKEKSLNNTALTFNYSIFFKSWISNIDFNQFLMYNVDSLINRNSTNINISINQSFYSKKNRKNHFQFYVGYFNQIRWINFQGKATELKMQSYSSNLVHDFNFKNLLNLKTELRYNNILSSLKNLEGFNQPSNISNFSFKSKQRFKIIKDGYLNTNFEWINNNIGTKSKNGLLFVDVELNLMSIKNKLNYSVSFQNVTNLKTYSVFRNSNYWQSFTELPLVGRNAMFKIYYQF